MPPQERFRWDAAPGQENGSAPEADAGTRVAPHTQADEQAEAVDQGSAALFDVEAMTARLARLRSEPPMDGPLPAHHPQCLGCGTRNPHGHHLRVQRSGDAVVADHVFDSRHVGAPGIAHGGAVATVFDDLFGFALYLVGEPAVTRTLTVSYMRPVLLDVPYVLRAAVDSRDGRSLHISGQIHLPDHNQAIARAEGEFVIVGLDHFMNARV